MFPSITFCNTPRIFWSRHQLAAVIGRPGSANSKLVVNVMTSQREETGVGLVQASTNEATIISMTKTNWLINKPPNGVKPVSPATEPSRNVAGRRLATGVCEDRRANDVNRQNQRISVETFSQLEIGRAHV